MNFLRSVSVALGAFTSVVILSLLDAAPARAQLFPLSMTVEGTQTPTVVTPGRANVTLLAFSIKNNELLASIRLRGLRLTNVTTGPGTTASRDVELGTVSLYRDNGSVGFDASDTPIEQGVATSGVVSFTDSVDVPISAGATVRFLAVINVPLAVRDGDALDLSINQASDLTFDQAVSFTPSNTFPVSPAGSFPIDGLVAAQVGIGAVGSDTLIAGTTDNVAFVVVLPANGYEIDQLRQLAVVNQGTAVAGSDIQAMRAWVDDGDAVFEPAQDRSLGSLLFTGARWQVTGLTEPMPLAGLRLFFTVDVPTFATNQRTIQLALPSLPDVGIGVASNNDGPIDRVVGHPRALVLSTANRVTWGAEPVAPSVARPGDRDVMMLHLTAANAYATTQQLHRLTVANTGTGGTVADRDRAVQSLALRADGNGDGVLGSAAVDPVLGTAFFSNGSATFQSLAYDLPPKSSRHLFLTADVSLTHAADSDVLGALVTGPLDVQFDDTTRVVAAWPLDSGARVAVDGMIAAQLTVASVPAVAVAPNDTDVLAFDVIVPRNGHANDTLQGLSIVNLGTAGPGDIAEVRWWRDGGDGVRTPGTGDDVDLGPAAWNGSGWSHSTLAQTLGANGARLFASLAMTSTAADSATVQLAVPVGGVTVASENDGPLDLAVACPTQLVTSNSPLLAVLAITPAASATGQIVTVTMEVRNTGGEVIAGITPSALAPSGAGTLDHQSGPTPASVSLAPGGRDTLRWTYRANAPGTVRLTGSASGTGTPSGAARQSLPTTSGPHQVFAEATQLAGEATLSLPATVSRGQSGVTAMTLRLSNPGAQVSPVRFRGFRLALRDEGGAGVVPDLLLSRVAVQEGTTERLSRTTLESSGSEVDLTLATPVLIGASETVTLTVVFDLLATTTQTNFRVALLDSDWFVAEDANTGGPVSVGFAGVTLPIASGIARVVESPTRVELSAAAGSTTSVGAGQADVPMLTLRLLNPGTDGITGDARVSSIAIDAGDTLGASLALLADAIGWIRVRSVGQTLTSRAVLAGDGPRLSLALNPAVTLQVNVPVDLFLSGDVATAAAGRAFQLRLADSIGVNARDANTQAPIPVAMTSSPLPGPTIVVQARAETLLVGGTPRLPANVRAGDAGVGALGLVVQHPGGPGTSAARIDSLVVRVRDGGGGPLSPAAYLSRLRVLWNGVEIGSRTDPPVSGEAVGISLGGQPLLAGESSTFELVLDFSAAAPAGMLQIAVLGDDLFAADAHLGTRLVLVPSSGAFPFSSGITRVQAPARTLIVSLQSLLPAALARDGREVKAATMTLVNPAPAGAGDILVDHLVLRAGDAGFASRAVGSAAGTLSALSGGVVWAQSAALSADSVTATLTGLSTLSISPGAPATLELRFVPAAAASGDVRFGVDAAGIGVVQPGSALLQVQVQPATGSVFPLWTDVGHFGPADLAGSYSNFPNPFAAGREVTRFAYFLERPARLWLRITALDGQMVSTLLDGVSRDAGLHQEDQWDGRNGVGQTVRNGVYVAELVVEYEGGPGARALRKVAVVR